VLGASCGPDCNLRIACENGVWQWHHGGCPRCAAPDTPIGTPLGERPIASLGVGDLVYSVDHDGIVVVPIVATSRTAVSAHRVMHVELEGGAVLEMSPGHPTAAGRPFGELGVGSLLDEQNKVVSARLVPYAHEATYDILPGSSTGSYFAAGALVGSTLKEVARSYRSTP